MTNLAKEIKTNTSKKYQLSIGIEVLLSKIKIFNNNIRLAKKNIFEKFIEIVSFQFIKYDKKYQDIIRKNNQKINDSNQEINRATKNIVILEITIANLKEDLKNNLVELQNKLLFFAGNRYINNYTKVALFDELNTAISSEGWILLDKNIQPFIVDVVAFYENPQQWIDSKNKIFIANEKINEKTFFDTIESNPLTEKQKDAVLINENNNLILAGAGSGKTSVIVAKILYLINKKVITPDEILVLAFNKNARVELDDRLKEKGVFVKVKTFHSFGLSIVGEITKQKPDLCSTAESPINMQKFIKNTIHKLLYSNYMFLWDFTSFTAYFKIPYKNERKFKSLGECYDYQKNYSMKTLEHEVEIKSDISGKNLTTLQEETVKSHQELMIANFLTLSGIRYSYEEPYKHHTATAKKRQYKPDFYLPDYDIYIEHFGVNRNNNVASFVNKDEYLAGMKWKIAQHLEHNTTLIQTFSYESTENNLIKLLKEKLLTHGVIFRILTSNEINKLLRKNIDDNKFTKLFTTFLSHYKSNRNNFDHIKSKYTATNNIRTKLFIKLFGFIFNKYEEFQHENNCIDFDDMIIRAVDLIESEKYTHKFKHIFIDEFQDMSVIRALLIKKLLPINNTSITAVGDDWQSIYRFAGSDIKIIQDFTKTFGISQTTKLDYTFRFNNILSNVTSDFIQKNPYQINKKIKTTKTQSLNKFSIFLYWTTKNYLNDLRKIIDIITEKEAENNIKILVLARYNFILTEPKNSIKKQQYPNFEIKFTTIHRSKGDEADYVIILDMNNGEFGFPAKIEDDPILDLVILNDDNFEDAEERRLFYVALTRTKKSVFLLSDFYNKSDFIKEIEENYRDDICFLNHQKTQQQNCPECKTGLLIKRTQTQNKNKHFYGCSNFPKCEYIENLTTI